MHQIRLIWCIVTVFMFFVSLRLQSSCFCWLSSVRWVSSRTPLKKFYWCMRTIKREPWRSLWPAVAENCYVNKWVTTSMSEKTWINESSTIWAYESVFISINALMNLYLQLHKLMYKYLQILQNECMLCSFNTPDMSLSFSCRKGPACWLISL